MRFQQCRFLCCCVIAIAAVCFAGFVPARISAQMPVTVPPGVGNPKTAPLRAVQPEREIVLFNGRDFANFYTFLPSKGVNNDPEQIFTIENGIVKVSGKEFGYFATVNNYANYRLTFEAKWGEKKWPPREKVVRDSGVLVHIFGADKVWPKSFECQIQENDFGDIFHIDGVSSIESGKRQNGRVVRRKLAEKPHGQWNTVELIVNGDAVTSIVNGVVEHEATQITRKRDGKGGRLNYGRICFQSEGAEVYYRNIVVRPLAAR